MQLGCICYLPGLKYACVDALKLYEAFDTTGFGLVKC